MVGVNRHPVTAADVRVSAPALGVNGTALRTGLGRVSGVDLEELLTGPILAVNGGGKTTVFDVK